MNHEIVLDGRGDVVKTLFPKVASKNGRHHPARKLPEILFVTSYPPRECGIATYSQDLFKSLNNKFSNSFSLKICALEAGGADQAYPDEVKYTLDTTDTSKYVELAQIINADKSIRIVMVQHEFGFFSALPGKNLFCIFYTA